MFFCKWELTTAGEAGKIQGPIVDVDGGQSQGQIGHMSCPWALKDEQALVDMSKMTC